MITDNSQQNRKLALFLLTVVYAFNFIDRQIVGILSPFIQADLGLTSTQMGYLGGLYFAALYTFVSIPIALLADRMNRVNILSISLGVWSLFTAFTGMAQNFLQIGLARMGVGIGEAGGSPPSHSVISDLYPKEKRASALGVYSLGIPIGLMAAYFISAIAVGKDPVTGEAANVSWRGLLIFLGITGILLAVALRLIIKEPKRGAQELDTNKQLERPSFSDSLKVLLTIKSWWFMCLGIAFASFTAYAFNFFQTKYLLQLNPKYDLRQLLIYLGIINGVAYVGGTYIGAVIADKFGKKSVRAYGWVPALAVMIAFPATVMAMWVGTVNAHLICAIVVLTFLGFYLGPSFAIAQTLAPIHMRAMSTALFFFVLNIIALGGGPTVAGILIDHFATTHSTLHATRLSLTAVSASFVLSIIFFLLAARTLPKDWAAAEARNKASV